MLVIQDFPNCDIPAISNGSALSIGNFDGCHLGHQELLKSAIARSRASTSTPTVLSFDPPPQAFFKKEPQLPRLFSPSLKQRALQELGIELLVLARFDEAMSKLSHDEFYSSLVHRKLQAKSLSLGENFCFGKNRLGDIVYLKQQCARDGTYLDVVASANYESAPISSSRIRHALQDGQVELANAMLGHCFLLEGTIVKGDQKGRILGFPTANLEARGQILPASGVYCGWVHIAHSKPSTVTTKPLDSAPAVFNIGTRPTIHQPNAGLRIEAHILENNIPLDSLYGKTAAFYLFKRLRDEIKFDGFDALKQAIANDVTSAKALLTK
jgi:riboflavin kinase/FMN adenylyltransferase